MILFFSFPLVIFLYTSPILYDHTSCILVMAVFLCIFLCVLKKNKLTLRAGEFTLHNPRLPVGPVLKRLRHVCVFLTRFFSLFLQVWGITSYRRCRTLAGCKHGFGIRHKVTTVTFNWIGFKNSFCSHLSVYAVWICSVRQRNFVIYSLMFYRRVQLLLFILRVIICFL